MGERKAIPARLRFEVFKRDKFTCQYCGATAPSVVLHVDHIKPVVEGGGNEILNLMTSCSTCNGGKGAVPIADTQAIDKQRQQLEELEERRQQIEMMLQWRTELQAFSDDVVQMIVDRIRTRSMWEPNENGRADIRRWLKRFDFDEIVRACDEAFDTYLAYVDDEATRQSWSVAFAKIPGVANVLRQQAERPYLRRLLYIQGIVRIRMRAKRFDCVDYLEHLHLCGADLDDMERRAKRMHDFADFEAPYDAWLLKIGRPF